MASTNIELLYPIALLPKQKDAFDSTKITRYTVYSGAVGAGKTLFAAHVAIEACLNNPGAKGFLGCLTYTQLKNVLFTTFKEEMYKYQDTMNENDIPIKLLTRLVTSKGNMEAEFYNGSIIYFIACEKEEKIRGYNLDFFILDEPIEVDETIFTQLMARLRGKHLPRTFGLLTTNPGAKTHWIYQKFYTRDKAEYAHIDTCTYDNIFLDPSYIKDMEEGYDEDWVKRMLKGEWGAYTGQIFKCFNNKRHVRKYDTFPDDEIKYYVAGVDWGMTNPSSIITLGFTKKDNLVRVIHEYRNDFEKEDMRTSLVVSKKIAELHNKYHYRKVWCDPSAKDLIVQTRLLGVPIEKADNDVEGGIGKINSLLQKDELTVDRLCHKLIQEMPSYRRKRDKVDNNLTEEPVKKDDHSIDAVRYGLTNFRAFNVKPILGYIKKTMWDFPR